jgi:hypothetical protein
VHWRHDNHSALKEWTVHHMHYKKEKFDVDIQAVLFPKWSHKCQFLGIFWHGTYIFKFCIVTSFGVLGTTLCDKVCQWLAAGQWFSFGTPIYSINKTDHHDIIEILLKVALNTIIPPSFENKKDMGDNNDNHNTNHFLVNLKFL